MRAPYFACGFLLAAAASAQGPTSQSAGKPQWGPSSITPEQIAAGVDNRISRPTSLSANTIFNVYVGDGGRGSNGSQIDIASPTKFRIEFPYMERTPQDLDKRTLVANGQRVGLTARPPYKTESETEYQSAWRKGTAVGKQGAWIETPLIPSWHLHGVQNLLLSFGVKGNTLTRLVKEARASGYQVKADAFRAPTYALSRITITGKGRRIEVVTDPVLKLPLTLRSTVGTGAAEIKVQWTARWNVKPGRTFDPKLFRLPTKI